MAAASLTTPEAQARAPQSAPGGPTLLLEASPRLGFRPLQVALHGTLGGVSRDDANFCHAGEIWIGHRASDPEGRDHVSTRRPQCHHPPERLRVELRHYKDITLNSPGIYTYRLILKPKDGQRVISNPVTIQVLTKP